MAISRLACIFDDALAVDIFECEDSDSRDIGSQSCHRGNEMAHFLQRMIHGLCRAYETRKARELTTL